MGVIGRGSNTLPMLNGDTRLTRLFDESYLPTYPQPTVRRIGISTGHDPYLRNLSANTANFLKIAQANSGVIRLTCEWSTVQPTNSTTFDWTIPDMLFDLADAKGIRVLFILLGSPSWSRTNGESSNAYPPTDPNTFGPFCAAAVNRYKNRGTNGCKWWEIWNEPNGSFGFGATTYQPSTYATLLQVAYRAIKGADSNAYVVLGGIDGGGGVENFTGNGIELDTSWLQKQYAAGIKGNFDALGFHPYAKGLDPADTTVTGLPTGSNLHPNGTFDVNISNWFGDTATVAQVSSPVRTGAGAMSMTVTGAGFPGAHYLSTGITVVPGTNYLGQAWVLGTPGDLCHITLNWMQSDGSTQVSFTQGADVSLTGQWQLITSRGLAPALGVRCKFSLNTTGTPIGHVVYVDDCSLNVTTPTSHGWNHISQVRAVMLANGDDKPIWLTEWGQASSTDVGGVTEAVQSTYVTNALNRYVSFPYVNHFYLHQDIDNGTNTTILGQNYGLTHTDGSLKAAYSAFRDFYSPRDFYTAYPINADKSLIPNTLLIPDGIAL